MTRISVFGSLNLDLVIRVGALPAPGETVSGYALSWSGGGKGANQAYAAARLSGAGQVRMIGCIGSDDAGRRLAAELAAEGVDTSYLAAIDSVSGIAAITVEQSGENTVVVYPGANAQWPAAHVATVPLESGDVIVAQLEIPLPVAAAALRAARDAGAHTVLNAAPAHERTTELLGLVDTLVVNSLEMAALFGSDDDIAIERARGTFAGDLLITRGAHGTLVAHRDGRVTEIPAFRVQPVDTVGAGDAFVGALAAGIADGRDLEEAVRRANAAGALTTTGIGARHPGLDGDSIEAILSAR